jgi:hypothetical protein
VLRINDQKVIQYSENTRPFILTRNMNNTIISGALNKWLNLAG